MQIDELQDKASIVYIQCPSRPQGKKKGGKNLTWMLGKAINCCPLNRQYFLFRISRTNLCIACRHNQGHLMLCFSFRHCSHSMALHNPVNKLYAVARTSE